MDNKKIQPRTRMEPFPQVASARVVNRILRMEREMQDEIRPRSQAQMQYTRDRGACGRPVPEAECVAGGQRVAPEVVGATAPPVLHRGTRTHIPSGCSINVANALHWNDHPNVTQPSRQVAHRYPI